MDIRIKVALGAFAALAVFGLPAPDASAVPLSCEHRGMNHAKEHGGQIEDDRFHLLRGERVSCGGDSDHKDGSPSEHHDAARVVPGHRDRGGFHCFRMHCG
jgi:hypothetical protein